MAKKIKTPEIYHETMSEAIQAAKEYAEQKGYTIGDHYGLDWQAMQYETYQTRLYILYKDDKQSKKTLNISLYRMPSGRYELTTYIN